MIHFIPHCRSSGVHLYLRTDHVRDLNRSRVPGRGVVSVCTAPEMVRAVARAEVFDILLDGLLQAIRAGQLPHPGADPLDDGRDPS